MLSRENRLRLTEIATKVRLNRETTLSERIWMNKLIEHSNQARGIVERIMCPYKVEDM